MFNQKAKGLLVGVIILLIGIGTYVSLRTIQKPVQELPIVKETPKDMSPKKHILGTSLGSRPIEAYTFGTGERHFVFVGGIHGGYEWNSVLLAYAFIDHLTLNKETIPEDVTVTVIPAANPDGVYKATGKVGRFNESDVTTDTTILASARFNENTVDLNRNFDCLWKPKSTWQSKVVDAGAEAFSEPETRALRNFILEEKPTAVIFWHSKSNAVYASQCKHGILPDTRILMKTYANASGYPAVETFDAYETTGAADDWLASIMIPAITVELKTRDGIEWDKNLAGAKALLTEYGK